jgi:hypothetical protein
VTLTQLKLITIRDHEAMAHIHDRDDAIAGCRTLGRVGPGVTGN